MTDGSVRGFRHTARDAAASVAGFLTGKAGLSKSEQLTNLTGALDAAQSVVAALSAAIGVVAGREEVSTPVESESVAEPTKTLADIRHEAKDLLVGKPGISADEQEENFQRLSALAEEALDLLSERAGSLV